MTGRWARLVAAACAASAVACGRKGPPLPPLVKIPVAPYDVSAQRRGDVVELQFAVPNANTDRSKPANVSRVDVYGFTGSATVSEADVLKHGAKVATVAVKAPRDPNETSDPDDPASLDDDENMPEGEGLDQGAVARVEDRLTGEARVAAPLPPPKAKRPAVVRDAAAPPIGPLLGPPPSSAPVRTYLIVGVATNGKRGPASRRVVVPLNDPPAPPSAPDIAYNETAITLSWHPSPLTAVLQEPATGDVLPARPFGITAPRLGFSVYEKADSGKETPLTMSPLPTAEYRDSRMTWGATRCYVVRTVEIRETLSLESEASEPACTRLVDTFAPAAPKGLNAVAGSGEINLIWDPSPEPDLDGYLVLRGTSVDALGRVSPLLHETTFHDTVPAGVRYVYVVLAVDRAGNRSLPSAPIEETAR